MSTALFFLALAFATSWIMALGQRASGPVRLSEAEQCQQSFRERVERQRRAAVAAPARRTPARRRSVSAVSVSPATAVVALGERESELLAEQFTRDVLTDPARRRVMAAMIAAVGRAQPVAA